MPTAETITASIRTLPGVTSAEVDDVKPGVFRVRVVGGPLGRVRAVLNACRAAGTRVVIEHRADESSAVTEMFL